MKPIVSIAAVALLCLPTLALADVAGAPSTSTAAAFSQVRAQMTRLHTQERDQMLGTLTPAHRTLLSNIVGQMATSANPDRDAAARTLDAALSRTEAQSIIRIHQGFRAQSEALMKSARSQFEATLSPEQRQEMQARMAARQSQMAGHEGQMNRDGAMQQDAGHLLLRVAMMRGGSGMGRGLH